MRQQASLRSALLLLLPLSFLSPLVAPSPAAAAPAPGFVPQAASRPALQRIRYYYISCVPYARQRSGISIQGNAWQWWGNAAGRYARGQTPAYGAVLAFRSIPRMPLGHVAVVSRVINSREILVDQANWMPAGQISLGVPVVDVSPENDWTEVRVGIGGGHFGTEYPTYGFIYRTQPGEVPTLVANGLPLPPMSPADLRLATLQGLPAVGTSSGRVEVAEAPVDFVAGSALVSGGLRLDAPDHRLR
jgi:CHAP domain